MKAIKRLLLSVMVLASAIASGGLAEDNPNQSGESAAIANMRKKLNEIDLSEIDKEKSNWDIASLIFIIDQDSEKDDMRCRAVAVVEVIRAEEAIPVLIANLEEIRAGVIKEASMETLFPCCSALISIGAPASVAILAELHKACSDNRLYLLLYMIRQIDGEAAGKYLLDEEIKKEEDKDKRANLQKALEEFKDKLMWETANAAERAAQESAKKNAEEKPTPPANQR